MDTSKPHLTKQHKDARIQWAVEHRRFTIEEWSRGLFSDEKSFSIGEKDGRYIGYRKKKTKDTLRKYSRAHQWRIRVYQHLGWHFQKRKAPAALVPIDVMIKAEYYIDNILIPHAIAFIIHERDQGRNITCLQDNAPLHKICLTKQ